MICQGCSTRSSKASPRSRWLLFTGIIEDLAAVKAFEPSSKGALLRLKTRLPLGRIRLGDSIAVNGTCLTVISKRHGEMAMEVSAETLRRTVLGELSPGDRVNLERCLTLGKLIGGHLVAGHVDGVGRIVSIRPEGDSCLFGFEVPASAARYLVEKGSIAIDGVSLTLFSIRGRRFSCAIIPHTLKMTTLGFKTVGAKVNIESDMMVKYVERVLTGNQDLLNGMASKKVAGLRQVPHGHG